jgi:hypothetical protein
MADPERLYTYPRYSNHQEEPSYQYQTKSRDHIQGSSEEKNGLDQGQSLKNPDHEDNLDRPGNQPQNRNILQEILQ